MIPIARPEARPRRGPDPGPRERRDAISSSSSTEATARTIGCRRAAGAAAEGDGRLPGFHDAARDRPGALDQADRRRRRPRPDARARHRQEPEDVEQPGWDDLYEVGTAAIVHKLIKVPDGTLRILVQGVERIRLEGRVQDDPYLVGEFEEMPDVAEETPEVEALTRNVQMLFGRDRRARPYLPAELQSPRPTSTTRARSPTSSPPRCG